MPTSRCRRASSSAHLGAQHRVQVRERLVEQQQARLDDQGAGERHPLLLAAGELRGPPRLEAGEPHLPSAAATRAASAAPATPRSRSPKATFSNTERCGQSA